MNKILYTLLAILCIGVSACSDDDAVEVASLNIVQSTVDFSAAGGVRKRPGNLLPDPGRGDRT